MITSSKSLRVAFTGRKSDEEKKYFCPLENLDMPTRQKTDTSIVSFEEREGSFQT